MSFFCTLNSEKIVINNLNNRLILILHICGIWFNLVVNRRGVNMKADFVYGSTRVKPHIFGNWKIEEFVISKNEADRFNMRQAFQGKTKELIREGTYMRLEQLSTGFVVMSNTPMELNSNLVAYKNATGKVLVAGLGMGMILDAILSKDDVTKVRVVEVDKDIIDYVGSFYKNDPRVEIIHADIRDYFLKNEEQFSYIWIDIWDGINESNLDEMYELNERFSDHCTNMNLWSMDLLNCEPKEFYKIAK
jgi:hypothetical protein